MIPPEPPPPRRDERAHPALRPDLLTGGLAHDVNNMLAVVIGSAEALAIALADREDLRQMACTALSAAERGAELLSRPTPPLPGDLQPIGCAAMLDEVGRLLASTLGEAIQLEIETPSGPALCLADRAGLASAILNLGVNARDAMPFGGVLTLGVEIETGRDHAGLATFTVRDTGIGMSPQVLARAAEPFFTTKPAGQGLGLSQVRDFARGSGGRLELRSVPGRGATARLSLPLAPFAAVQPVAAAAAG
jgi:signal transduction histidine kinase